MAQKCDSSSETAPVVPRNSSFKEGRNRPTMLGDSPAKPTSQRHSKRATGDDGDHNMSDADEMEMEGVFSSGPGDDLPSDAGQEGDAPQGEASKPSDISSRFYASREVAAHGSEGDA